jgi:hypothetical protein
MIELTSEQRMIEMQECNRREDLQMEQTFWRDVFFASFEEADRITPEKLEIGLSIADAALSAYRHRFQ